MASIKFQLVTPERTVMTEEVDSLSCPTIDGQITILPHHVPLIAPLAAGELVAKVGGKPQYIAVAGGFVEVRPDNEVVILADTAEHAHEINEQRAEEARKKAEEALKNKSILSNEEFASVAAALQKNMIRLRVAHKHRSHGHGITQESTVHE